MQQGFIWRIGTGANTHAWDQNWIPRDHVMRPVACTREEPPVRVSEFINTNSATWNKETLDHFFLPMDVKHICKIPLSTHKQGDIWAWHYVRTGILDVRSVYRMLVCTKKRREDWLEHRPSSSNTAAEGKLWIKLWKTLVPSKLRMFLWRLAHQSLPTGDV
jgi:hypothetical protein